MLVMPREAKPGGRLASVNELIRWNCRSKTSTALLRKSVANNKLPRELLALASPLYTAPEPELSTARIAAVPLTLGFQPEMVPSSVAKMKTAGPELPPEETTKSGVPLKTMPVGAAVSLDPCGGGMVTVSASFCAFVLYSVDTPVPLSAIQKGLVGLKAMPQGFLRLGSVVTARPGMSDTRLCWM